MDVIKWGKTRQIKSVPSNDIELITKPEYEVYNYDDYIYVYTDSEDEAGHEAGHEADIESGNEEEDAVNV
jgi:2,3-bisphosphoglycerate-independent phosphoglycerate mutase